jgi:hypothetical protein
MSTVKQHNAYLVRKVSKQKAEIAHLRTALEWIGNQFCERTPENDPAMAVCSGTQDCITEYCLPCYAKAALNAQPCKLCGRLLCECDWIDAHMFGETED